MRVKTNNCAHAYPRVPMSLGKEKERKPSPNPTSIRASAPGSADGMKSLAADGESVEAVDGEHLDGGGVAGEVEADDDDEVGEDEDGAFEVVALFGGGG